MSLGIIVPTLDREIQRFRHLTGARDISIHNEMARYARARGVINNLVVYPMIARQNAGTGATVYPWGGLTRNQMTLFNGPGWTSDGLTFAAASSQYGSIPDFLGSETITVFVRTAVNPTVGSGRTDVICQADFGLNRRSWRQTVNHSVSPSGLELQRSSDGQTGATVEVYGGGNFPSAENTYVSQWVSGGGRGLWLNKTPESLTLTAGFAQTARYDSASAITLSASLNNGSPTNFSTQTARALAFLTVNTDNTIRETLTDMINAL